MAGLAPRGALGRVVLAVAVVVALTALAQPKSIHSIAGPFRIVPKHLDHCPPEVEARVPIDFVIRGVRARHDLDLWSYSGNFTTHFTWTNDHDIDVNFASWSSRGGWKDNYYVIKLKKFCDSFKLYAPNAYKHAMLAINKVPDWKNCTWLPGVYHVTNLTTDFKIKAMPVLFYGKWRITLRLMENNFKDAVGCFRAYADTVPKVAE